MSVVNPSAETTVSYLVCFLVKCIEQCFIFNNSGFIEAFYVSNFHLMSSNHHNPLCLFFFFCCAYFNYSPFCTYCVLSLGKKHFSYYFVIKVYNGKLRASRALLLFNDVPLRTRRALLLYKVYGNSALLVLNGTSLNNVNALLVLSRCYVFMYVVWRCIYYCVAFCLCVKLYIMILLNESCYFPLQICLFIHIIIWEPEGR